MRGTVLKSISRTKVSIDHKVLFITLAHGRELFATPGHPDAYGRDLALLQKGDFYDRAFVKSINLVKYEHDYTYDILPEGETGTYLANGVLIGSILKKVKILSPLIELFLFRVAFKC